MAGTRTSRRRQTRSRLLVHALAVLFAVLPAVFPAGGGCIAISAADDGACWQPAGGVASGSQTSADRGQRDTPLLAAGATLARDPIAPIPREFPPAFETLDQPDAAATLAEEPPIHYMIDGVRVRVNLPPNTFEDTGPGTVRFSMSGLDVDAQRSVAGGRARLIMADNESGRTWLEPRLAWLYEYLQSDSGTSAFFAPGDKGIYAVQGLGYGHNWIILGTGLRWELAGRWSAFAGYDTQVNSQQMFHIGSAGIGYTW